MKRSRWSSINDRLRSDGLRLLGGGWDGVGVNEGGSVKDGGSSLTYSRRATCAGLGIVESGTGLGIVGSGAGLGIIGSDIGLGAVTSGTVRTTFGSGAGTGSIRVLSSSAARRAPSDTGPVTSALMSGSSG